MKLKNDNDVSTEYSILGQYSSKELIELDASLVKTFQSIGESLIRSMTYQEIKACMEAPNEEISLTDSWSSVCFIMLFYVVELCFMYIFVGFVSFV